MGLLNALTSAVNNYGDDIIRNAANQYGDDALRAVANNVDDVARVAAKQPKIIYHGTNKVFDKFDENLPSIWFTDNADDIANTGLSNRGGKINIMERELPDNLKLADWDLADRLTKQQLKDRGYDGIAYAGSGSSGKDTYYEIFNPNKTLGIPNKTAQNNIDDILKKLGISQNEKGQFVANGVRSYDNDKAFWQKLQEIAGGERVEPDYFMYHRPSQTGIYADDLIMPGFDVGMPADVYDNPQYYTYMYGETPDVMNETMAQLNAARGNPNAQIDIYRATTGDAINDGDWITLSPSYAKQHLRDQLDGNGRVISQKANVRDIQFAGDDLAEWGFYPQSRVLPDETQAILAKLLGGRK